MENQRQGKEAQCEEDHEAGEDNVLELDGRYNEDHSYDRDVISEADLEWTETLHVLASHYDSVEEMTKSVLPRWRLHSRRPWRLLSNVSR